MKKRIVVMSMAVLLSVGMAGCTNSQPASDEAETSSVAGTAQAGEAADADQQAADHVAALIDDIYVQKRTEDTDRQCKEAKEAWDALTDVQKELVEGTFADPEYFGRDTGDASKDDTRNQDHIGENEILVVSFGTSFNDSRVKDIKGIEDAIAEAYPDWSVRRAFTSQIIINHIQAREGHMIDNMDQALERAGSNGVKNLVIQPTHLMRGAEYDELMETVEAYADKFEKVQVAEPLLGQVGEDASVINEDKKAVAEITVKEAVTEAGYDTLQAAAKDGTAFVLLGHGTSHQAKVSYSQMQTQMNKLGYDNVWIGTVEGEPEETSCEAVINAVAEAGYKKVILRPLMVVAGDHAENDMAGEEDSWLSSFEASGKFEEVTAQIAGLGSLEGIQQIYVAHTGEAMSSEPLKAELSGEIKGELPDGTYLAEFTTDSGMFRVNEVYDNKGILTVKDGEMTIHITLGSENIVNLYPGLAKDAEKATDGILQPTKDSVTYSDDTKEVVNGFDVPVPALGEEFDLALIGKKGVWYDHKVTVSDPEPFEGGRKEASQTEKADQNTAEGAYTVDITFEGGSGKAKILSPVTVSVDGETVTAVLQWNSPNYDYMVVDGEKYLPVNTEGDSVFEVPVKAFDEPITMIGDTVAMSKPHEVEYRVTFHSQTMKELK